VEEQDRRIFYVACGITLQNRPGPEYYTNLTDITLSAERLATLWRYLLRRDVTKYNPAKAPPVSVEKEVAQLTAQKPFERHLKAALALLRQGKRTLVDSRELAEMMTAMGENERTNTDGEVDDCRTYDFSSPSGAAQSRKLSDYLTKLWQGRIDRNTRAPTVYGLRNARDEWEKLTGADDRDVLDALEDDRRKRLPIDHVWSLFRGPCTPEKARQR
jgi:hypothetical protein